MRTLNLTAVIEREGDGYVALCPEVDVDGQGATRDEARNNLREPVDLFFASADRSEIDQRLKRKLFEA